MKHNVNKIKQALEDLKQGKMILLTDDESRENEGDLIIPAETITPEIMSFMIRYCSGIVCLCLTEEKLKQLNVPLMVPDAVNKSQNGTGFTVSIEASTGISTGVSAQDRTRTIKAAIADDASADDIVQPGHIFPLRAKENGVFARRGHTEGAIDLAQLAGFGPSAVLCEVMNDDGTMAKGEQLEKFAQEHELSIISIQDIVDYRLHHEDFVTDTASANLPVEGLGDFSITVVKDKLGSDEHIVLQKKNMSESESALVRIHSACITGDLFGSLRCDCGKQLQHAMNKIAEEGGVLIYSPQEGRGIGLFNKVKAYALQEKGLDTVEANQELGFPADGRDYTIAANILKQLGIKNVRLLTNNRNKINSLNSYSYLNVVREPMPVYSNEHNVFYLNTKRDKLNHVVGEELL